MCTDMKQLQFYVDMFVVFTVYSLLLPIRRCAGEAEAEEGDGGVAMWIERGAIIQSLSEDPR